MCAVCSNVSIAVAELDTVTAPIVLASVPEASDSLSANSIL